jgi:UDP-N-acetyl-2-amino-2-deoxyglucuronate dehydrogenase
MKNFALIGAAGYVAPRHLQAIHETGHRLVAAFDPCDSVGILDRHFPEARFFTELGPFARHLERLQSASQPERLDYLAICSPSHLHDAHLQFALEHQAHAICEKPLVLHPAELQRLRELEQKASRRVYAVLQLRLQPALVALQRRLAARPGRPRAEVALRYVTRRGAWYHTSWKGQEHKSGGIAGNIGIHLFDLLGWLFGAAHDARVHLATATRMAGRLELEGASVKWLLSVDPTDLPRSYLESGKPAFRSLVVDGEEIEFSDGFADLHTSVYRDILSGGGFGLDAAEPAIALVHRIRQCPVSAAPSDAPAGVPLAAHPATAAGP